MHSTRDFLHLPQLIVRHARKLNVRKYILLLDIQTINCDNDLYETMQYFTSLEIKRSRTIVSVQI